MTPDQAYAVAFKTVWRLENGGDAIVATNTPGDSGGYTRGGLALAAHPEISRAELDAMTVADFGAWYRLNYWTPNSCDELSWPLSLIVFDGAVNGGSMGAKALQAALDVRQDGNIGPVTIAAAKASAVLETAALTLTAREKAYRQLNGFDQFGKGWIKRLFVVALSAGNLSAG